jgi:isopentenyl-diphosphate delta-isomerase
LFALLPFHCFVVLQELQSMMDPSSGLHWSPWFRIIAKHFLPTWWKDLQTTLHTDARVDTAMIHKLEC